MPKRGSPTPAHPTRAGPESGRDAAARRAAIAALLHRLNGGLHNAALAFELALSRTATEDAGSDRMLDRGLAGVEQASRAATLLALMVDPTAMPPAGATGPYAEDVADILRSHARKIGSAVDPEFDVSSLMKESGSPAATAELLLEGLAKLQRAATR